MTDYDLLPKTSLDGVRFYGDSMAPIQRGQSQQTERHGVLTGGSPASNSTGLEPGEIRIRGTWLGSDAKALADRLRAIFDDPDTETVTIDTVGTTTEFDGDYRLADDETIEQIVAGNDAAYRYQLTLIEL